MSLFSFAQQLTLSLESGLTDMTADTVNPDMDAKTYYPRTDDNDELCALIKVSVTNPLKNSLILDVGGVGVVDRTVRENGEIWFWVPTTVLNLKFSCLGYNEVPKIPVSRLESGHVYRIKFRNDARHEDVIVVDVTSNYLKINVFPEDAIISLGKRSSDYSLLTEYLTDGQFDKRLDFGRYYYKIEHEMYETKEGYLDLTAESSTCEIRLKPAYGYLNITTSPSGANVFVDGESVGVSPISKYGPVKRGTHCIRAQKSEYHTTEQNISVIGDGQAQNVSLNLNAQFATVTCVCDDMLADIYVDDEYKAKGKWTGNLSSSVTHVLEARRLSHRSQSISFSVRDGETITKKVGSPVPLYGSIVVETIPKGCDVILDGKNIGKSPLVHKLLIGNHKVDLSHDGYLSESHNVNIKHNEETLLSEPLTKGRLKANVTVTTTSSTASIYRDGVYLGKHKWVGVLEEGDYVFTTMDVDCNNGQLKYSLRGSSPVTLNVPAPVKKTGTASLRANRSGADIYVTSPTGSVSYYSSPANNVRLPIGKYSAYAKKTGYYTSATKSFYVYENQKSDVVFDLKKRRWIMQEEDFSHNFLDFNYGFGIPVKETFLASSHNYLGLDYTYLNKHIGVRASTMFGLEHNEFAAHIGPVFRLTDDSRAVDFQLYAGAGVMSSPEFGKKDIYDVDGMIASMESVEPWKLSGDVGLKMNFDSSHNWSWFSLSMGCKFTEDYVIPNIGTSILLPASVAYLAEYEESRFASHFLDFVCAYDIDYDEVLMGAHYAWCSTHIGLFGSFLYGMEDGMSLSAGPVIRLTPDSSACDFQIYGGPGYMNDCIMGDVGMRLGWHSGSFSWWDFTLGCQMYEGSAVPYVGLGLGISLTVVTAGLAAIYAMFTY